MRSSRETSSPLAGIALVLGCCALMAMLGCQLLSPESPGEATTAKRPPLAQLQPTKDAIQLDLLVIDRRADDPMIGKLLWKEMDQVGAAPAEIREMLMQNGCLVGRAAARPPAPLLQLLGLVPEIDGSPPPKDGTVSMGVTGRTHFIRSGTEAEMQISDVLEDCNVTLLDGSGARTKNFELARCLFRVKPVRLQDGWVRVEFVPEIHHGEMRLRPRPTELGWANYGGQDVEKCHPQEFAVTLNVGESVVITAADQTEGTLGQIFFRREVDGELRQRMLVVRLAQMGRDAE